jgi:hypothetical protein
VARQAACGALTAAKNVVDWIPQRRITSASRSALSYTPEARLQQVRSLAFFNQFALLQQSDSNK